jgi:hydrogenase maturation protease
MANLREQLDHCFQGRVCLMGLGNVDYGDDGAGVRLAEILAAGGLQEVIVAGTTPERFIGPVADTGCEHVIFLDAVEFGGPPGSVVFLDSKGMTARFPQVSTHKISLGLLAEWAEERGSTKAWLLGIQPESLKPGPDLTPTVRTTLEMLSGILGDLSATGLAHPAFA